MSLRRLGIGASWIGVVAFWLAVSAAPVRAGCGSECACPLENPDTHLDSRLLFEVSHLYIDQNQPRVGSTDTAVGALPSHHDEVRTVNRVTNARGTYRPGRGWTLTANLPYVHRTHEHIHHHGGQAHYERWNDRGLGDLELGVVRTFATAGGPRLRVGLGVKAPTGKQDPALTDDGDPIEPSARLGTGSWDLLASAGAQWQLPAPGKAAGTTMPLRLTFSGRANGRGVASFRHGAEAMVHFGLDYPISGRLAALVQSNYRVRAKDDVGDAVDEEEANTGGAALYLTPGLRWDAIPGFSLYGLAQFPVWERVNGIQIVSESNLVFGISRSIL
jgi:hypothetical protein